MEKCQGTQRPELCQPLKIAHNDGSVETIMVHRLGDADRTAWISSGFDKEFLVFHSIDRSDPKSFVDQEWFNWLSHESAEKVVRLVLELNGDTETMKVVVDARQIVESVTTMIRSGFPPSASPLSKD